MILCAMRRGACSWKYLVLEVVTGPIVKFAHVQHRRIREYKIRGRRGGLGSQDAAPPTWQIKIGTYHQELDGGESGADASVVRDLGLLIKRDCVCREKWYET